MEKGLANLRLGFIYYSIASSQPLSRNTVPLRGNSTTVYTVFSHRLLGAWKGWQKSATVVSILATAFLYIKEWNCWCIAFFRKLKYSIWFTEYIMYKWGLKIGAWCSVESSSIWRQGVGSKKLCGPTMSKM
jgi:hypothetical protein